MRKEKRNIMLMTLPAFIIIFLIVAFVGYGVLASFTDKALIGRAARDPEFVGLANYARALRDPDFFHSIEVTWWYTLGGGIIGQCSLGLLLAVVLKQKGLKAKALVSAAILAPWVIPGVVSGFIMGSFWHSMGLLNRFLGIFGISPVTWLTDFSLLSVTIANIWRGLGWSFLLFSAALTTIPQEYYDAADVDGATSWHKFRTITLPLALPVIIINIFLITIWTWGDFDLVYVMTGGGPGVATLTYPIMVYRDAFAHFAIGYGSALAIINMCIIAVLAGFYLWMLRRR